MDSTIAYFESYPAICVAPQGALPFVSRRIAWLLTNLVQTAPLFRSQVTSRFTTTASSNLENRKQLLTPAFPRQGASISGRGTFFYCERVQSLPLGFRFSLRIDYCPGIFSEAARNHVLRLHTSSPKEKKQQTANRRTSEKVRNLLLTTTNIDSKRRKLKETWRLVITNSEHNHSKAADPFSFRKLHTRSSFRFHRS